MLQPHSPPPECDHSGREVSNARHAQHETKRQRGAERCARFKSPQESLLLIRLSALDNTRRSLTTPLDFCELAVENATRAQRFDEDIGGFNGIGNCAVDAYSTDGQHDVGGVAEQQ
jgi:hypothetical protein